MKHWLKALVGLVVTTSFSTPVLAKLSDYVDTTCAEQCTFVLKKEGDDHYTIVNPKRASEQFTPWSTFKVPNTLIALDTGVIQSLEQKLTYDSAKYPKEDWWPEKWYSGPLTIREAFHTSAVPIYRQLATDIGVQQMHRYLKQFAYGNEDLRSGLDSFWLNGSIKISAIEQVDFMQRFYHNKIGVKNNTYNQFKQIMLADETDEYTLYGKTGGGGIKKGLARGWYFGFVETKQDVYYFAMNIDDTSFRALLPKRKAIALDQMEKFGVL